MQHIIHDRIITALEIIHLIDNCTNENIEKCNECPLAAECMARKDGVTSYLV